MPRELDGDHALTLFLGGGRSIAIGAAATPASASDTAQWPAGSLGSILVRIGPSQRSAASMRALLTECHRGLRADGRLAVALENRLMGLVSRIRSHLPFGPLSSASNAPAATGPSLGAVLGALRAAGFDDISTFVAAPTADDPLEIRRPRSRAEFLWSPAYLITAGKAGAIGTSLIERIGERVVGSETEGDTSPKATVTRVTNSTRGKSMAFVECGTSRIVIRIPRSEIARDDEANAHVLLRDLRRNPLVAPWIARPVLAGTEAGHSFYAESRVAGRPLAGRLSPENRADYAREAGRFLTALNPDLDKHPAVPIAGNLYRAMVQPMLDRALEYLTDPDLRRGARSLIDGSLRGAQSRLGFVHGDFGASNILVSGERFAAVVDWEAARRSEPPVLDVYNYLDSVHRTCTPGLTIVDTVPLLFDGDWPEREERDLLERFLGYCGIDIRFRRGFALLYFLHHIGPQLRFTNRETGPRRRLEQVIERLISR